MQLGWREAGTPWPALTCNSAAWVGRGPRCRVRVFFLPRRIPRYTRLLFDREGWEKQEGKERELACVCVQGGQDEPSTVGSGKCCQHWPLQVQVRHLRPAQKGPHLPGPRRRNVSHESLQLLISSTTTLPCRTLSPASALQQPHACCSSGITPFSNSFARNAIVTRANTAKLRRCTHARTHAHANAQTLTVRCWFYGRATQGEEDVSHERCAPPPPPQRSLSCGPIPSEILT